MFTKYKQMKMTEKVFMYKSSNINKHLRTNQDQTQISNFK